jgi:phospholipid/cholesterol/gamma-HCH transport system substrate-binding protein
MLASRSTTLASAIDDAGGTVNELRSVGQKLPSLVDRLEETAGAVEQMAEDITSTSVAVRRVVEEGGRDVKRFTAISLPEIQSVIHELRLAADNLRRFSESLEQDPSVLVYGPAAGRPGPGE